MKTTKPITVLFDANPLAQAGKSGVGYYTYRLVEALAHSQPDTIRLIGHYYNFLGRKHQLDLPQAPNIEYRTTRLLPGALFNGLRRKCHIETPLELLARRRADVLFFPNFVLSPSLFRKPRIVTIHDLYFLEKPEHIQAKNLAFLRQYVPRSVKKAAHILAVSQFTKEVLQTTYHVTPDHVSVTPIPPPASTPVTKQQANRVSAELGIAGDFILFVGNLEPRKNLVRLIEAYQLLDADIHATTSLVLAGGKGWNDQALIDSLEAARSAGLNIITPGYITDEQKNVLYHTAKLVAVPSLYEGFGMQLLEAMEANTPLVASDIAVFKEVAADACNYVDPLDPQSIANELRRTLTDSELRATLVKRGNERLTHYRWPAIADDVFTVIKEVTRHV